MNRLQRNKHLILLIVTIVGLMMQPMTHRLFSGPGVYNVVVYFVLLAVFAVVFENRRQRTIAAMLALPSILADIVAHLSDDPVQTYAALVYHGFVVVFLISAVTAVLRDIFNNRVIERDHVVGAFCGYLLIGVAWGNIYLIIDLMVPDAFNISSALAHDFGGLNTRRFLFDYYSFMTLMTVGYGDVTPVAPMACTMAWLEALVGQFYMAVLVGQLIGLKLAQAADDVEA